MTARGLGRVTAAVALVLLVAVAVPTAVLASRLDEERFQDVGVLAALVGFTAFGLWGLGSLVALGVLVWRPTPWATTGPRLAGSALVAGLGVGGLPVLVVLVSAATPDRWWPASLAVLLSAGAVAWLRSRARGRRGGGAAGALAGPVFVTALAVGGLALGLVLALVATYTLA